MNRKRGFAFFGLLLLALIVPLSELAAQKPGNGQNGNSAAAGAAAKSDPKTSDKKNGNNSAQGSVSGGKGSGSSHDDDDDDNGDDDDDDGDNGNDNSNGGCENRCLGVAENEFRACRNAGGSRGVCLERVTESLTGCLEDNCDVPSDCADACGFLADLGEKLCRELGFDRDDCEELADEAETACLADGCVDVDACIDDCVTEADRAYDRCRNAGGTQANCTTTARNLLLGCLSDDCNLPGECEDQCRMTADAVRDLCRATGGSTQTCNTAAQQFLQRCNQTQCPDDDQCAALCTARAEGAFQVCLKTRTASECAARAQEILVQCVRADCDLPTDCDEACLSLAATASALCGELAVPTVNCGTTVQAFLTACLGACTPPATACGGSNNTQCGQGQFCEFPPGTCDVPNRAGVCMTRPDFCITLFDPVCACNGETYSNECFANMAGQSVDHPGPCEEVCGGIAGIPCPDGQFCRFAFGTCNFADQQGVCVPIADKCPTENLPACGCDGVTYRNECEAIEAGVQVDHPGPCVSFCGSGTTTTCPANSFCFQAPGTCDDTGAIGICAPRPTACPQVSSPVCGCNGQTYANICEAFRAGTSAVSAAACP